MQPLRCHRLFDHPFSWLSAVVAFLAIPAPADSGVSDELWDLIRFGRAGARGRAQKRYSLHSRGIGCSKADNQPPYVHDVSFLDEHPKVSYDQQVLDRLAGRGTRASSWESSASA